MIRIFIADDHAVLRRGLELLIGSTHDMEVAGTAADGRAVLQAPEIDQCDVVILDLSLPKVSGGEVVRRLRQRRPELPILILSMYPEDQYALQLLRAGASGYLSKDRSPEELLLALRKVAAGGTYLTDTIARQALHQRGGAVESEAPHERLSPREQEVFRLIVQGRTVSEIAAEIDLGQSTVSNHLRSIKAKLRARSLAEVVSYAHRVGLVGSGDPEPE